MIEVSVTLKDYHEVELFGDFLQILDARREIAVVAPQLAKHSEHVEIVKDEVPSKADLVAEAAQLIRGAAVIDTPPAPDAPKVTMADMEAAAQASLKARQLVGTRAIIDTIAPGKRISEIDQALWPALLEKLKVVA